MWSTEPEGCSVSCGSLDSHRTRSPWTSGAHDADVLLLDDLGAWKMTEWMNDTLFYILNSRYMAKRPTVITTNFQDVTREKALAVAGISGACIDYIRFPDAETMTQIVEVHYHE